MKAISEEKWDYLKSIRANEVDHQSTPQIYKDFVAFLDQRPDTAAHYVRYCQTFLAMAPYLGRASELRVLETGGFCDITRFLKTRNFQCRGTKSDLRYSIDAEDASADILLSLEVIEHLKDQTETKFEDVVLFRGSGISCYASEIKRVLAPDGLLILTTPNPCSARVLELLIGHKAPMIFRPHEREYTGDELVQIFCELELVERRTHNSFFHLGRTIQGKWRRIFQDNGWDFSARGDDHFIVFRKR
jgi:SAM-dependent methyltransferase